MRNLLLIFIVFALAACSTSRHPDMPRDGHLPKGDQGGHEKVGKPYKVAGKWYHPKVDPTYDQVGYASWYGKQFHGKKTANGEVYNMNALTAAHKTLPMPSYVKVTNISNGRSLVLRVNDRGPFVAGRIIDVSRRGAQLLGFEQAGVTRVRVQASDAYGKVAKGSKPKEPTQYAGGDSDGLKHFVQIGSYSDLDNAEKQARRLRRTGEKADLNRVYSNGRSFWRVRVGPYAVRSVAEEVLDRIVSAGFYEARIFSEAIN